MGVAGVVVDSSGIEAIRRTTPLTSTLACPIRPFDVLAPRPMFEAVVVKRSPPTIGVDSVTRRVDRDLSDMVHLPLRIESSRITSRRLGIRSPTVHLIDIPAVWPERIEGRFRPTSEFDGPKPSNVTHQQQYGGWASQLQPIQRDSLVVSAGSKPSTDPS